MEWILALGCAFFISGGLTLFSQTKISAWEERGFVDLLLTWKKTFFVAALANILVTVTALFVGGEWWQSALLGLIAWMLVFSVITDFATYKIPSETSIVAYLLPLIIVVPLTWGDKVAYISMAIWFGAIFLLDILGMILKGGIGGADIRLFLLVGSSLSWWVGIDWMFYAFGISAFMQLVVFAIARVGNWGRIKPLGSMNALNATESKTFKLSQKMAREEGLDVPKGRKVLPFGPSILVTFLIMGIFAAAAGNNACSAYGGLICF